MTKVRWTTRCAGGCGKWLPSGTRATKAYGHFWCDDCVALHKDRLILLAG